MYDKSDSNINRILLYFLIGSFLIFILAIFTNVNAMEQTGTFSITTPYDSPCGSGSSGYCAIQTNQSSYIRSLNSTYNGVLQCFSYNVHYRTETAYQYTLYIEGMDNDFRNNSLSHHVCGYGSSPSQCISITTTMKFISKNKLSISFPSGVAYSNYTVDVCGSPLTGVSNYGIKKTYFKYDDGQQDMSGIISNNNTNTDNIINNNNSNTEDIINNNNQNTQDIIDNQNQLLGSCHTNVFNYLDYTYNNARYNLTSNSNSITLTLTANGNYTGGSFPLIYSLNLKPNTSYYFRSDSTKSVASTGRADFYIYDSSNQLLDYTTGTDNFTFTTNSSSTYSFRIYITSDQRVGDSYTFSKMALYEGGPYNVYHPYNEKICDSKIDDVTGAIDDLTGALTDPNVSSGLVDDLLDTGFFHSDDLLSIIVAPLDLATALTSDSVCQPLELPFNFSNREKNAYLPCGSILWSHASSSIVILYRLLIGGFILYHVCIGLYFSIDHSLDPFRDKMEVLDL